MKAGKINLSKQTKKPNKMRKIAASIVLVALIIVALVSSLSNASDKEPVSNQSNPKPSVSASASSSPTASATPSEKTSSASPSTTPKEEESSQAPSPSESPVSSKSPSTPSSKPSDKPSATSISTKNPELGKQAVIMILNHNTALDIYEGKFTFPYEKPEQEDMKALIQRVKNDGAERAGFDLAGLYVGANKKIITERLNNVNDGSKRVMAVVKVDLDFIQKIEVLSDKYQKALKSGGTKYAQKTVWPEYNKAAVQLLKDRTAAINNN